MVEHRLSLRFAIATCQLLLVAALILGAVEISACKSPSGDTSDSDGGRKDSASTSAGDGAKDQADSRVTDLPVKTACSPDAGPPSKGKSESCTCNSECRSGYCVDGVCCTSACGESCKACNLPNALGDCSFIPAGVAPTDASICKPHTPATCGPDGTCDGRGGCRLYVTDTVCSSGTCDGDGLSGVKTCDGKGACSGSISKPCAPYSCDPGSNLCDASCATNAQCSAGQSCAVRSCGMKLNGFECTIDSDCASGYCSDGTCCNVACNGACLSCNQTGSVGRCRFVPAGLPDPTCPAQSPSTCGTTGLCDGSGACALYPETTPCGATSCSGSTLLNTARACDGKGSCQAAQLVDCSPYRCTTGACSGACSSDADCATGHACVLTGAPGVTGNCGKKKNGQSCGDATECESAECVDGVCCESSCQGACRSCALPGSPGQCVDVPAGAPDPRKTCTDDGKVSCGHNGVCDGTGACQIYPVGTECGSASCSQGSFMSAPTCNQSGQCVAPPSRTCNPYVCNGTNCFASCTKDDDCVAGSFCVAGSCGKKPSGAECSAAGECQSGFCAQGICCNSACTDACKACNLSATLGLCTAVPDGAPDPQEQCKTGAQSTCGTTGACLAGACAYFAKGLACKLPVCASTSSESPASACDGRGSCVTPADLPCGTFVCSSTACLSSCTRDGDCVSPNTCVNSSCGLKPNGAACTIGNQCGSGFCTEGVCCNSACSDGTTGGLCKSCKVAGKVGTCSAVQDGQADPKQRCGASNPADGDCSNDGTCNGGGACRPWSTATGCRQASCAGSSFTPAANCDGAGNCPAAISSKCDPYKCSATSPSCLTTCTSDADCITGETCLKTNNQCGSKLANGQSCKANSDCNSNACSTEGVCCNSVCDGACESCVLQSKVGSCSNIAVNGTPRDSTTCAKGSTCGNTSKCNGAGGCQLASAGTVCGSPTCAAPVSGTVNGAPASLSIAEVPAPTCDGSGGCVVAAPVSCAAYQCDSGMGQCKTTCTGTLADCNDLTPSTSDPSGGNSCVGTTCQKLPNGAPCSQGFACASGNCVDAVCCGVASCGDGLTCTTDTCSSAGTCTHAIDANSCVIDGACYAAGTVNPNNSCQECAPNVRQTNWSPRSAGTVCRTAAGPCDVAEVCDGTGAACPADGLASSSTVCRAANGPCDVAETCTGTSVSCPTDALAPSTTVCRASAGPCDVAETCTGSSANCPGDSFVPSTTVCRPSAGACDVAETCTGSSANCPGDSFVPSTTVCRPSAGACDVAETCTGSSANCPADGFVPSTTVCRPSAGECDVAETCTGSSASCPGDSFVPSTTVCRPSAGVCDVAETCTGTNANCPGDSLASPTVVCRPSAGACDVAETCTGTSADCPVDALAPSTTVCRPAADVCDIAETCTGAAATCPTDTFAPSTMVCRPAVDVCDIAETCVGTSAACPANGFAPSATACGTAGCSADQHATVAPTCDGSGTCSQGRVSCATGYLCVGGAGGTCATTCSDASACDVTAGYSCNTGTGACEPNVSSASGGASSEQ